MKTNRQKLDERLKELADKGATGLNVSWAPEASECTAEQLSAALLRLLKDVDMECPHDHKLGKDFEKHDDCESPLKCPMEVHECCECLSKGAASLRGL